MGALYNVRANKVHATIGHNFNNFKNLPKRFIGRVGYIGGHSGYDTDHVKNNTAKFYSLTNGVVLHKKMPKNPLVDLSYLAIHNKDDRKVIFYVHLSHIAVKKGEKVHVGKYLGKQGWNKKWSEGYHIHLEVRTVLKGDKPPTKTSLGAAAVFNNPNIEPIRYLYGELLEELGNRPVRAAPSILRTLTQTWGDLKSKD